MKISDLSAPHMQMIEAMKSQLLIVLVNRLGGDITIPVSEVDGTGKFMLSMAFASDHFRFVVSEKQR